MHCDAIEWLKFLHITFIFAATLLLLGANAMLVLTIRRRDPVGLQRYLDGSSADSIGVVLLGAGVVFGVWLALAVAFDLTASWLVATYVLLAIGVVVSCVLGDRKVGELRRLLGDGPADEMPPQLAEALRRSMVAVFVAVIPRSS